MEDEDYGADVGRKLESGIMTRSGRVRMPGRLGRALGLPVLVAAGVAWAAPPAHGAATMAIVPHGQFEVFA